MTNNYIVVGLGNPGEEYVETRHNLGRMVLDAFAKEKDLEDWKNSGFRTILNSRTKQHLQQSIEIWEDYYRNIDKLNIETVCIKNTVQSLVIHGNADEAVSIEEGRNLAKWMKSNFLEIKGANHTFGASHPWNKDELPENLKEVCDHILEFIS